MQSNDFLKLRQIFENARTEKQKSITQFCKIANTKNKNTINELKRSFNISANKCEISANKYNHG